MSHACNEYDSNLIRRAPQRYKRETKNTAVEAQFPIPIGLDGCRWGSNDLLSVDEDCLGI